MVTFGIWVKENLYPNTESFCLEQRANVAPMFAWYDALSQNLS